jgi:CO/xanthine dehydrogenase Mo-binding subunit
VAAHTEIISDAGAYMYTSNKVLYNTVLTCTGPYYWPNATIEAKAVYTNNVPGGAFRGFGGPQGHFAAESQMNKLAEVLELDPVAIRLKNTLTEQTPLTVGTTIPGGISLTEVIEKTALAAGWTQADEAWHAPRTTPQAPPIQRGWGLAAGFKNIGFSAGYQENSWAKVELQGDTEVEVAIVSIAGADVGQGHHTAMTQIAAEALDLPLDKITLQVSDTAVTKSSGSASASRLTMLAGNAVLGAAQQALQQWQAENRPTEGAFTCEGAFTWLAPPTTEPDPETGYAMPNFAYGYVAQAAEVSVDTETGFITVHRLICANDVGKAINPAQIIGQIEGAVVQAHGYTLLENFQTHEGVVLTPYFNNYLIPGVYDIPHEVESIIVEDPHPDGPYGVRGMAEMPYLPYAPAIIAAVHQATGVWFDRFPLTPERVLRGLGKI